MNIAKNNADYNLKQICLCCLKNELVLHSIYKSNLKTWFITLTHLEITEDDKYPSSICIKCMIALKISSSFVEQCRTSYKTLTERRVKRELDIKSVATYDDILLDNSSDQDLTTFNNGETIDNTSIITKENSSCGNDGTQLSPNTTDVSSLNHDDIIDDVEEAKNNAKTLPITLTRIPHVPIWEETQQKPMVLEDNGQPSSLIACSPIFNSSGNLKSVIKIETTEYKCSICVFRDKSAHALLEHQKSHAPEEGATNRRYIITSMISGKKVFTCSMCKYTKPHLDAVKIHFKTHKRERPFKFDVCSYASNKFDNLTLHKLIHTRKRPFKCDVCTFTSITSQQLKDHKMMHKTERPFKCDVCSYMSFTSQRLSFHKMIHTGERPFKCDICSYASNKSDNLTLHKLIHTRKRPFKCDVCTFTSITPQQLKDHKMRHMGARPFKCDVCPYGSSKSQNLTLHKLTHTKKRPFKCDACTYTSITPHQLKDHKMMHMEARRFRCNVCPYASDKSDDLTLHKFTHTRERPFKCDVCTYTSNTPHQLKNHKMIHLIELPFKCDVCTYTGNSLKQLNYHKRIHTC